jgi:hypothetical protein
VVIETPGFKFGDFLWSGSMGAAGMIGQAAMVLFLTYFLLLSGDTYKRKLVRLTGPSLSNKKITVHILDDYQRFDPALHADAAGDQRAGRVADLVRIALDRPR